MAVNTDSDEKTGVPWQIRCQSYLIDNNLLIKVFEHDTDTDMDQTHTASEGKQDDES